MSEIEHHGVKGMRWGVRKPPRKTSSDYKKTAPYRGKHATTLSNKQLKDLAYRMSLESTHTRNHPSKAKRGDMAVKSILATVGTVTTVYNLFNSPAGKAIRARGKNVVELQKTTLGKKAMKNLIM